MQLIASHNVIYVKNNCMEKGARFIDYKEKEIYYVDYSNNKTSKEFLEIIKPTNAFR